MNAPAFLSLVAESNALMGDLPADFSSNIVQIGALMMPPKDARHILDPRLVSFWGQVPVLGQQGSTPRCGSL